MLPHTHRWSRGQVEGRRLRALIPRYRCIDDALDEIVVFHPRLGGGIGHIVTVADEGVGVGLENPKLTVGREAEIEPGVVPEPEGPARGPAGLFDPGPHPPGDRARDHVPDSLALP